MSRIGNRKLVIPDGVTATINDGIITVKGPKGDAGQDGKDGQDGADGLTPFIGQNGNWWVGEQDTGVKAQGDQGQTGVGIQSIAYNGEDELVVTFDNGQVVNLGVVAASLHVHDYECETLQATCTTDGYFRFVCKTCGHVETVVTKAQGHLFEAWREKVSPTCTSEGVKSRKCTVCGYEETETIPAHEHHYSENCVYDANKHWHYCTECGVVHEEEDHNFVNHTCSVCNYTQSTAVSTDGLLFGLNDDGQSYALISYGTSTETIVDIPSTYNGYPVTKISSGAFQGSNITSVTMPNTIKQIGDRAFYNIRSLTSVVLSNNIEEIPSECFSNTGLTSVVIPDGIKRISDYAFYCCYSLTSVVLSNSITYIGYNCFSECDGLKDIVIPSSVRTLSDGVFRYCDLLSNIVLNNGLKEINYGVFQYCNSLQSIVIPSSVYYIGSNCFAGCSSLTNVVFEQPEGWYKDGADENIYKEIWELLSDKFMSLFIESFAHRHIV